MFSTILYINGFSLVLPLEIILLFMSLIEHIPNLDDASNLIMINKK